MKAPIKNVKKNAKGEEGRFAEENELASGWFSSILANSGTFKWYDHN